MKRKFITKLTKLEILSKNEQKNLKGGKESKPFIVEDDVTIG